MVLAESVIILSGTKATSWNTLCKVSTWISLFRKNYTAFMQPTSMPNSEWMSLKHCLDLRYCVNISWAKIGRENQLYTYRSIRHGQNRLDKPDLVNAKYYMDNCMLLPIITAYLATKPKDYVYAMGGFSSIRMRIDYSENTTVAQVYQPLTAGWLQALAMSIEHGTDCLLCDLWFLELAGYGFLWERDPSLASWSPNFA